MANDIDSIDLGELAKRKSPAPFKQLSMKEGFDLMNLINAEYTASGMNDRDFAKYAQGKIKLSPDIVLNSNFVSKRREQLGIANNVVAKATSDPSAYTAMLLAHEQTIKDLQERITVLEGWVNSTFPKQGLSRVK